NTGSATTTVPSQNNQAPTADSKTLSTNEDTPLIITLTGSDPDGDALTFTVITPPAHGTLGSIGTVSCTGNPSNCSENITYTPFVNYNGADSFTYKANDGSLDSNTATVSITVTPVNDPPVANPQCSGTATVSITVTPVNDPPVANNDSATVAEGGTVTVLDSTAASVLANDTDAEGNTLTATKLSDPAHGSVTLNADGTFSY